MAQLKRSNDRKVSPSVRVTQKSQTVRVANAFGLPAGNMFSCPGMTSICANICYANKLEKIYSGVRNAMLHNWELVKDADYADLVTLIGDMLWDFVKECQKRNADPIFRIHWDGDFFSLEYAEAWRDCIKAFPSVQFWVYTRSFTPTLNVVPILSGLDNLVLYLSVDTDNMVHAAGIKQEYPAVKIASLAKTASEAKTNAGDISERVISCPENVGKLPLVVDRNKDGNAKGACAACKICVVGRNDVAFAISGKE